MLEVEIKECVVTHLTLRGRGTAESPYRRITEVWVNTNQGCEKIAEYDHLAPVYNGDTGLYEAEEAIK